MSAEQYATLRDDVAENGVRVPIVLYEGKVLDGVHRQRAAIETGRELPTTQYSNGGDPEAFVLSANLARRHLNNTERMKLAARLYEEGDDRRGYRSDLPPNGGKSSERRHERAVNIARRCGIGKGSLWRALALYRNAPAWFERANGRGLSISSAYERWREERDGLPRGSLQPKRSPPKPGEPSPAERRATAHAREVEAWKRVLAVNGAVQKVLAEEATILEAIANHRDRDAVAALANSVLRSRAILDRIASPAMERLTPGQRERVWALLKEGGYA
jgi:hypothetical protein